MDFWTGTNVIFTVRKKNISPIVEGTTPKPGLIFFCNFYFVLRFFFLQAGDITWLLAKITLHVRLCCRLRKILISIYRHLTARDCTARLWRRLLADCIDPFFLLYCMIPIINYRSSVRIGMLSALEKRDIFNYLSLLDISFNNLSLDMHIIYRHKGSHVIYDE